MRATRATCAIAYHGRMGDFEKRWQRIAEALQQEMSGDVRPRVASGRTLFGIRSEVEEKMDRFAQEIEAEQAAKRAAARAASHHEDAPQNEDTPRQKDLRPQDTSPQ